MGGGGGGSDSGSGGYDAAPMQYRQKTDRRKREEEALGGARKSNQFSSTGVRGGSYALSEGDKPSIVRSSSGSGVLTSKGVARKQAFETQEYMEATPSGGTASGRQTLREGAAMMLQKRKEKSINPLTRASLTKQIADLKAGRADPVKRISESGKFVTVGTQSITGGESPIKSAFADMPSAKGDDSSPEVTPEVTPEVMLDESGTGLVRSRGSKRGTRGKRSGQAGDFGEGILVKSGRP